MTGLRQINLPTPVQVIVDSDGQPQRADGKSVEVVSESWLIEDRWWTSKPLRRHYWEVVTTAGRNLTIYHDLVNDTWKSHR